MPEFAFYETVSGRPKYETKGIRNMVPDIKPINLATKLATINEQRKPRTVGEFNGSRNGA